MERCYAFGQAIGQSLTAMGVRTIVLASGGMSHYPGTDRYSQPALEWDTNALARLKDGNLKSLLGYDEAELDDTGNIELRCWACAAGALGQRRRRAGQPIQPRHGRRRRLSPAYHMEEERV